MVLIVILLFIGTLTGVGGWVANVTLGVFGMPYDINSQVRQNLGLTEQTQVTTTVVHSGNTNTSIVLKQINDNSVAGSASKTVTTLLAGFLKIFLDPRVILIILFTSIFIYLLVTDKI